MASVRIAPQLDERVRKVALKKGVTRSEVFRQALESYCDRELAARPSNRFDDVIGVVDVPGDFSARTREEFGVVLCEKSAARAAE